MVASVHFPLSASEPLVTLSCFLFMAGQGSLWLWLFASGGLARCEADCAVRLLCFESG